MKNQVECDLDNDCEFINNECIPKNCSSITPPLDKIIRSELSPVCFFIQKQIV